MSQIVYVDLSAKVEHWNTDSAIAIADGFSASYLVPAKVKQAVRVRIIELHGTKSVIYRALSLFVYMAVRDHLNNIRHIVIDRDYTGERAEGTIKSILLHLLRRDRPEITAGMIEFANVKGTQADLLARRVFERRVQPLRVFTWKEMEATINRK